MRVVTAKIQAARALWRMCRHLSNWRDVWAAYRVSETLPPLCFRRGFTLRHGPGDDPILLLHTVFANSEYQALDRSRSPVLLDIGANIGAVTLDRAWRDRRVRVDAYEPNPSTWTTLEANVRHNGLESRVRVFKEAVTGQGGAAVLWSGGSSVLSSTVGGPALDGRAVRVPSVSFDGAVARTGAERLAVKMDAEGAEVEMLESASDRTLAAIDELVLEYHDAIVPNAQARCRAVLTRAGFACRSEAFNEHQGILLAARAASE
jgi:FkbM family methyltransferase